MNIKAVTNVVSALVVIIGLTILACVGVSYIMGDSQKEILELFLSSLIPIFIGSFFYYKTKPKDKKFQLGVREGFGIVALGWVIVSIFGAIPYVILADFYWYDAFFETMSGFSTTGASVIDSNLLLSTGETLKSGIADLSRGLIFWRALTHWLGGMGIVVLSLAILPFLGIGGQKLYNAEVPGPTSDQLTPKIASSAKILWGAYLLLTIVEVIMLYAGGMSMYDSWCHSFASLATGGFSTNQASVGGYDNAYFDGVITLFMFLAGANFILHYKALKGEIFNYFKDEEFKFYLAITVIATFSIVFSLMLKGDSIMTSAGLAVEPSFLKSLQYSSFQVVAIMTTTGFATADFNLWPAYATILLVALMFVGGCGGSTGGGMKYSRVLLLLKYGTYQVEKTLFPNLVSNIRLNKVRIEYSTLNKVLSFFFFFLIIFFFVALTLTIVDGNTEMDFTTAMTASVASLGNIGPGLSNVGATCTYSWMSPISKIVLTLAMLLGRLELFTVLVLFLPKFWKK